MYNILINCFYSGLTVSQARDFIMRCYGENPSEKQITKAQKSIKESTGREWK